MTLIRSNVINALVPRCDAAFAFPAICTIMRRGDRCYPCSRRAGKLSSSCAPLTGVPPREQGDFVWGENKGS